MIDRIRMLLIRGEWLVASYSHGLWNFRAVYCQACGRRGKERYSGVTGLVTDHDEELFRLQETLYESSNPTRRWLHCSRRDWVIAAINRWGVGVGRALEVGPGSGVYLPTLAAAATEVVAIDIEDAYLDRLRQLEREY